MEEQNLNTTDGFNKQLKDINEKMDLQNEKFNEKINNMEENFNNRIKGFLKKSKVTIIAKNIEKNEEKNNYYKKNFQPEFPKLKLKK